jgi:hypothetical protein
LRLTMFDWSEKERGEDDAAEYRRDCAREDSI